jgi:hypothetical protein
MQAQQAMVGWIAVLFTLRSMLPTLPTWFAGFDGASRHVQVQAL